MSKALRVLILAVPMKRMSLYLCVLSLLMCIPVLAQAESGAVYAMTNPDFSTGTPNRIVVYSRARNGMLTLAKIVETDGFGYVIASNDALGSQGSLLLSPDNRWLFAVNAGSNSISVFSIGRLYEPTDLTLVNCGKSDGENPVASGGDVPVSLTFHNDVHVLYVLNAGGEGNITGFTLGDDGCLTPLADSTRSLHLVDIDGNTPPPAFLDTPAQVGFNPLGDKLVVTVKGALTRQPQIHVFDLVDHLPDMDTTTPMINVPCAFVFDSLGNLIVTEPFGRFFFPLGDPLPGFTMSGAVSSYQDQIATEGTLILRSTVGNGQLGTCWIAITDFGMRGPKPVDSYFISLTSEIAYTSSNGAISSYRIDSFGRLLLLDGAAADLPNHAPVDLAISPDNRFLYNTNAATGTVSAFMINKNGSLTPLQETDADLLHAGATAGSAVGIAVR